MNNKRKTTKRNLISSVISLILCVSMFIGTTFAWFTDSVTSGVNRIEAGTLDVELLHTSSKVDSEKVDNNTKLFLNVNGEDMLWEPGALTWESFTVKNVGTLALKYQLAMNLGNNNWVKENSTITERSLKDVIDVYIFDAGKTFSTREEVLNEIEGMTHDTLSDFVKADNLMPVGGGATSEKSYTLVLYWNPSDNERDNKYNLKNGLTASDAEDGQVGQLYIDLGIKLNATQYTSEKDSFDDQYDKDADGVNDYTGSAKTASATSTASAGSVTTFQVSAVPATESEINVTEAAFEPGALTSGETYNLEATTNDLLLANANYTVTGNEEVVGAIDLTLTDAHGNKVETFNDKTVTITTYIAKNLGNVSVSGPSEANVTGILYENSTGKLQFTTNHFSTYIVSSASEAYIVETDTAYGSLQLAIDEVTAGGKVTLLTDVLLENPIANKCITINKPIEIDGRGNKIYCKNESIENDSRLVNIYNVENGDVILNDIIIKSDYYGSYMRGLNIYNLNNVNVILNNVDISLPHYYAFNIGTGCTGTSITINDSYIKGWSTIYNHSSGIQLVANKSEFDSVNPELAGGETNSFGNVIVAEYYDWNGSGDSNNNVFEFNQCRFTADKNHPESDVTQVVFDIRSPYYNTLKVNNCSFEKLSTPKYIRVCYDTEYESDSDKREEMKGTNKLYINGELINCENAEYVEYYLDE